VSRAWKKVLVVFVGGVGRPYLPTSWRPFAYAHHLQSLKGDEEEQEERSSLLTPPPGNAVAAQAKTGKTLKAALYGVQVFYSFFIM